MLDAAGYDGAEITGKHVMENSCGDGAFLAEVVRRYCTVYCIVYSACPSALCRALETYIHGVEIDIDERNKCLKRLDSIAAEFNVHSVKWDVICADALDSGNYSGKMDFVIGNPPYVRTHSIDRAEVKSKLTLTKNGMTDLYAAFYEIGIKMLSNTGVLCYVTPDTLFIGAANKKLREHFIRNRLLTRVISLRNENLFAAHVYTSVVILDKNNKQKFVRYSTFTDDSLSKQKALLYSKVYINGNFYFGAKNDMFSVLRHTPSSGLFEVKSGFATLADKIFLNAPDCGEFTLPVIKASTLRRTKMFFPYKNGKIVPFSTLPEAARAYCEQNRNALENRSLPKYCPWYAYGRSQGIADVYKLKYAVSPFVRDAADIKFIRCEAGTGVYGSLYILTEIPEERLSELILNERFIEYVRLLNNRKQGNYYTFSSKDLIRWLDYCHTNY